MSLEAVTQHYGLFAKTEAVCDDRHEADFRDIDKRIVDLTGRIAVHTRERMDEIDPATAFETDRSGRLCMAIGQWVADYDTSNGFMVLQEHRWFTGGERTESSRLQVDRVGDQSYAWGRLLVYKFNTSGGIPTADERDEIADIALGRAPRVRVSSVAGSTTELGENSALYSTNERGRRSQAVFGFTPGGQRTVAMGASLPDVTYIDTGLHCTDTDLLLGSVRLPDGVPPEDRAALQAEVNSDIVHHDRMGGLLSVALELDAALTALRRGTYL